MPELPIWGGGGGSCHGQLDDITEQQGATKKWNFRGFFVKNNGMSMSFGKTLVTLLVKCQNSSTMYVFDEKKMNFHFLKSLLFGIANDNPHQSMVAAAAASHSCPRKKQSFSSKIQITSKTTGLQNQLLTATCHQNSTCKEILSDR